MTALATLWLPILLAAVFVFVASSVLHMVVPFHKGDYGGVPDEDAVRTALRGKPPGQYMFPHCGSMKDLGSEAMQQKFAEGPVGTLVLRPAGFPSMGKSLIQWFVFCLLVGLLTAYVTGLVLAPGAEYMRVFRITGTIAFLGYAFSSINDSIWKGVSWGVTLKFVFDGLVYSLMTAGAFAWLWPEAA